MPTNPMLPFDPPPVTNTPDDPTWKPPSYGRRLTMRKNQLLEAGIHPATKKPLAIFHADETCGSCSHCTGLYYNHEGRRWSSGGGYHKCDLVPITNGAATDIRLRWPACALWKRREEPK